jgi:hypothetical protein
MTISGILFDWCLAVQYVKTKQLCPHTPQSTIKLGE